MMLYIGSHGPIQKLKTLWRISVAIVLSDKIDFKREILLEIKRNSLYVCVCMHIEREMCICIYTYIHIEREREYYYKNWITLTGAKKGSIKDTLRDLLHFRQALLYFLCGAEVQFPLGNQDQSSQPTP